LAATNSAAPARLSSPPPARDEQLSVGQYTRDKRFGEAARYALDAE
jgi:hypothetical protein